jgi:hypothetical protein
VHDAVAREAGAWRELDQRRMHHSRTNAREQLDPGSVERGPHPLAGGRAEGAEWFGLVRDQGGLPRRGQRGDHERELVGRQRPGIPGRDDDRDALGAVAAQGGDDPVERLGVVGALEAGALLVGR